MQYEALYVRKRGNRFGLFFIHENSCIDSREAERREPRDFRVSWADWVRRHGRFFSGCPPGTIQRLALNNQAWRKVDMQRRYRPAEGLPTYSATRLS
jgi:hypothetical protein